MVLYLRYLYLIVINFVYFVKTKTSDKCDVVTEFEARKEKLKKENYRFKCLRRRHLAKECRKNYKCKMQNNYNTTVCKNVVKERNQ